MVDSDTEPHLGWTLHLSAEPGQQTDVTENERVLKKLGGSRMGRKALLKMGPVWKHSRLLNSNPEKNRREGKMTGSFVTIYHLTLSKQQQQQNTH